MTIVLHKIFNFIQPKQKYYKKFMKLFFVGPSMNLMKFKFGASELNEENYNLWFEKSSKEINDLKKLRYENFVEELTTLQ